jgi:hypothetical protein
LKNTRFQRILSRAGASAELRDAVGWSNYSDYLYFATQSELFALGAALKLFPCTCADSYEQMQACPLRKAEEAQSAKELRNLLPKTQAELERKFAVPSNGKIYGRKAA